MKHIYKPFRFINASEMKKFHKKITSLLQAWNEKFTIEDLKCSLSLESVPNSQKFCTQSLLLLSNLHRSFALIEKEYQKTIQHCLFGQNDACFTAVSDYVFLELLNSLFGKTNLVLKPNTSSIKEWIYTGSPTLICTFNNANTKFSVCLHPAWLIEQIPSVPKKLDLDKLEKAIAEQSVPLGVELKPIYLSLQDIKQIQIGDVVTTHHKIEDLLILTKEQQVLGFLNNKSAAYPTIQIRKT
jgi:hypothetical protein